MANVNSQNIFLIDGIGAILSTLSLGILLPYFQHYIGVPVTILYLLAAGALIFTIYSLCCYKFADADNPLWIRLIILGNLVYCVLTATMMGYYFNEMTNIGLAYFIIELLIIKRLVMLELRFARVGLA